MFYLSTEMQSVYSVVSADGAGIPRKKKDSYYGINR